ncbi:hypothetical protein TNCV_2457411 [Trichonephila clavipes]|nr:hypothetical protein TNCV_2457411 [Trichonephila clavipes]
MIFQSRSKKKRTASDPEHNSLGVDKSLVFSLSPFSHHINLQKGVYPFSLKTLSRKKAFSISRCYSQTCRSRNLLTIVGISSTTFGPFSRHSFIEEEFFSFRRSIKHRSNSW